MNVSLFAIFLEGLLSFLSPCVLPLLPLYMSYLAGDNKQIDEEGNIKYKTSKVFLTTLFFVLGISLTFALLSVSVSFIKTYIEKYSNLISIIGGILLIVFGLHEIGIINIKFLNREAKLNINLHLQEMNFVKAFLLGFVFSLGWSPCIGPMLANAILLASTKASGYLYILFYGLGLIIPFLLTGLLTSSILNFLNKKKNILKWVLKIAGVIILGFGIYMIYDAANNIIQEKKIVEESETTKLSQEEFVDYLLNYSFINQDGKKIKLIDYQGKYLFVSFSASWCTYCKQEIPEYLSFDKNNDDVACIYAFTPLNEDSEKTMYDYIEENIKLTSLIDNEGLLFYCLGINSYPTTYVISPEGKFLTYVNGMLDEDGFNRLYDFAKENNDN